MLPPLAGLISEDPVTELAVAAGLAALAIILMLLEFALVSAGLLTVLAIAAGCAAVVIAFSTSTIAGLIFLIGLPVVLLLLFRWGLARMQGSQLVTQAVITDDAGYRHRTDELGVTAGAVGALVTAARPTGRARFPGGECDVQVVGAPLDAGAAITVERIDGPTVYVVAAPAAAADASEPEDG